MKKIYLSVIMLSGLMLASCNDSFMDRAPEDSISDPNFWKTTEHLRLYVNNFYSRNDLIERFDGYGNMGIYTIDRDNGSDTEIPTQYNKRMNGEGTLPESGGGWDVDDWQALRDVNYFFSNYEKATGDANTINRYVGEALFFRSLFFFKKLQSFGDIPYYDELLQTNSEGLYKARDKRNVVVDRLMEDMDKAISYLPTRSSDGRISKEAAMMLQARIALYEGTWEKYHAAKNTPFKVEGQDGKKFIEKAAKTTDALIASGTCALDNIGTNFGYYHLFNQIDYAPSKEVILWRKYSIAENFYNRWGRYSCNGAGTGLTKSMIDSYLCTDGKPIEGNSLYKGDATLKDVVTNRDPRLNQSIYVNDNEHFRFTGEKEDPFVYPSFNTGIDERCVTGYQLYKGHGSDFTTYNSTQCVTGLIYFRYAEALLINAEAKAELGTLTQADLDRTINQLRDRVEMPHLNLAEVNSWSYSKEFPSLSNIINEIRRERKVELVAEGFRVADLFRWAAADELIKGKRPLGAKKAQWADAPDDQNKITFLGSSIANMAVNAEGYIDPYTTMPNGYNFNTDRDYLSPIPSVQLVLNPSLAPNNPGWNN